MNEIPYGYCQCGCGEKTIVSDRTKTSEGRIKGQPVKFLRGHVLRKFFGPGAKSASWKGGKSIRHGYVTLYDESSKWAYPFIYEHIKVMQEFLGRELLPDEVVHHINLTKTDNRVENLIVVTNQEHKHIHQSIKRYEACGNANFRKCRFCGGYDNPINMAERKTKKGALTYNHRSCEADYKRQLRRDERDRR